MSKLTFCLLILFTGKACSQVQIGAGSGIPTVTGIAVSLSPNTVAVGSTSTAKALLTMSDGSTGTDQTTSCQWSTSNAGVASVPASTTIPANKVTGVGAGTATITCTLPLFSAGATVTVSAAPIITNPTCGTPPCVLPGGTNGSAYSGFQFVQSGGTAPITYAVSVGTINTGLSLSAGGAISGTPSVNGTQTFTVTETAANGTATVQVSLTVVAGGGTGPPGYAGSRSDVSVCQMNATPPSAGTDLVGANTVIAGDNCFANRIVRATQSDTDLLRKGHVFESDTSGSADVELFNADSTCFFVGESGGFMVPFTFNTSTMQATRIYAGSFASTGGIVFNSTPNYPYPRSGGFDHTPGNCKFQSLNQTNFHLESVDLSQVSPPSPVQIGDLTTANCGNGTLTSSNVWFSNSDATDNRFLVYGGGTGTGQDTWDRAIVYDKALHGCWTLNMKTGTAIGDWGSTGAVTGTADRFGYHNVRMSFDGTQLMITKGTCTSTTCATTVYLATVGGTTIVPVTATESVTGHRCAGFTHWYNGDTLGAPTRYQYYVHTFAAPNTITNLNTVFGTVPDQHCSNNNANSLDTLPIFDSSEASVPMGGTLSSAWDGEVRGVKTDGSGSVVRFAHTYTQSLETQSFDAQFGIGSVSQDGKFFLFSSYWGGTLGSTDGVSHTCTYGTGGNCRSDAFIVELK